MKFLVLPMAALVGFGFARSSGMEVARDAQQAKAASPSFPILETRFAVDHRYAVKGSVTDVRPLGLGFDFMITLEQLAPAAAKKLDGFVELARLTGAAVKVDDKPTTIKFFASGSRVHALVPKGLFRRGQTLSLEATGTTTIAYAGQAPGANRRLFGTGWPVR